LVRYLKAVVNENETAAFALMKMRLPAMSVKQPYLAIGNISDAGELLGDPQRSSAGRRVTNR
jgi:hypothetical protein